MKQTIFAACSLHRYLMEEVASWVVLNEELVAEAISEVKEYVNFVRRQGQLNKQTTRAASIRIASVLRKHHPDLFPKE